MRGFVQTDFWKYTAPPPFSKSSRGPLQACLGHEAPAKWSLALWDVLFGRLRQAWLLPEQIRISGLLQICAKGVS